MKWLAMTSKRVLSTRLTATDLINSGLHSVVDTTLQHTAWHPEGRVVRIKDASPGFGG